jgi:hypothetical protein
MRTIRTLLFIALTALTLPLYAQQTGSAHGRVLATDGSALPGVTVEARSNVLPQPRVTVTDVSGDYRLPALQPGTYTLTYTLTGMQTMTRRADILLGQDIPVDVRLGLASASENITVTAQETLVNRESTAIQTGFTSAQLRELPITQDYRDVQKLIPGVTYSQDLVRGPSSGASGQDNVYMFDGVNITMPLFGVMNSDPNTHDIAQVNIIRGGAKAVDFDRAGGFLIDSVSKSGTNAFAGEVSYQNRNHNFVANQSGAQLLTYQEDRDWSTVNLGGPLFPDRLYFYGSYYRPDARRENQANLYGALPQYERKRNEAFGKLTYTPTQSWLINGSYRDSHTVETANNLGARSAPTAGDGSETRLKIGTLESSLILNPRSFLTFKLNEYKNPGFGTADFLSGASVNTGVGAHLDLANLDQQGRLIIPTILPGNAAQNAFVQPYIDKYGFVQNGVRTGGGTVGYGQFANDDDSFYRRSGQLGYNYTLGHNVTHDLHIGYQHQNDSEDRFQTSNGWGLINIPAGIGTAGTCPATACGTAKPAFFTAQVSQQTTGAVPTIHSEVHTTNLEVNDTIHMNNWTFNAGLMASQDVLYGQGLAAADNIAGYIASPGTKYKMHEFGFSEMMQPRLGATWAYNGSDTVYVSAARYSPPANSDARAASWDRNLVQQINAYFDANGNLLGVQPNGSSSGKLFQDDIKHPQIDEFMIGTGQQLTNRWSARLYTRYRKGEHYLDDTNNNARVLYNPPAGIPQDLYIPNLGSVSGKTGLLGAIGSGSTYVIANLDGAFTKYYEATAESEWHGDRLTVTGSYTWSHYYGNFDQDNTTFSSANDASTFIGSSNIGDGAGRQLWDLKYGNLRGDRRNVVKLTGIYALPWHATTGAFFVFQSGQPYQLESVLPYRPLTGSTSDTNRYAEPAGTRTSPAHHQLDLNYTQNIPISHGLNFQLVADVFNVYNKQTPYNYETRVGTLGFTNDKSVSQVPIPVSIPDSVLKPLLSPNATFNRADWGVKSPYANSFYAPRVFQLTARIQF